MSPSEDGQRLRLLSAGVPRADRVAHLAMLAAAVVSGLFIGALAFLLVWMAQRVLS